VFDTLFRIDLTMVDELQAGPEGDRRIAELCCDVEVTPEEPMRYRYLECNDYTPVSEWANSREELVPLPFTTSIEAAMLLLNPKMLFELSYYPDYDDPDKWCWDVTYGFKGGVADKPALAICRVIEAHIMWSRRANCQVCKGYGYMRVVEPMTDHTHHIQRCPVCKGAGKTT